MSYYREVRVRPVVRYVVTLFEQVTDEGANDIQKSHPMAELDNAHNANLIGAAVWRDYMREAETDPNRVTVFEPARQLKIDWLRGPGEPQEAIRWELSDPDRPSFVGDSQSTRHRFDLIDQEQLAAQLVAVMDAHLQRPTAKEKRDIMEKASRQIEANEMLRDAQDATSGAASKA